MPATLTIDDAGRATLEIPDSKGEVHAYALLPYGDRAWQLVGGPEGATYCVGEQSCGCPARRYGKGRACKHMLAVAAVNRFLASRRFFTHEPTAAPARTA